MKKISLAALVAAMMLPGLAMAQDVSVSASTEVSVSVSTPDVSSVLSSAESELSSAVSSVSSELSSASSELSSELSSSEMASSEMSSGEMLTCDDIDMSTMMLTPIDAAALASVTSVTVFSVDTCSGIDGLATIDGNAVAALQTNQMVIDAQAAQGQAGGEVVAYTLDGTSLTVYVRSRN